MGISGRAVLIDSEEGVLKATLNGPLGQLFDSRHIISDQYGAGNNWAQV
jgi:tubulin epsilon